MENQEEILEFPIQDTFNSDDMSIVENDEVIVDVSNENE